MIIINTLTIYAILSGNSSAASNESALLMVVLSPLFFAISFVYSSAGFGGGSSYIAILVLAGISLFTVPPIALLLNIIAASMAFVNYARAGYFSPGFALPFLSSIPFAFMAGLLVLPENNLALIFVIALFAASAALLTSGAKIKKRHSRVSSRFGTSKSKLIMIGLPIGAVLGGIAGLVGIGGGIWLSPLLILTGMADPKKAAATASVFILANSVSGFVAHSISRPLDVGLLIPLGFVVLAGGLLGSRFGAFKFNHDKIRMIVGGLVAIAGFAIMFKQLLPLA